MADTTTPTPKPFTGWPGFYGFGNITPNDFPYPDLLSQLQSTFWALPTNSYGRWNGTGTTQALGYPSGINPGPPGGYGLFGGGGGGGGPTAPPQGGGGTPTVQPQAAGGGAPSPQDAWDNYTGSMYSGGSGPVSTSSLTDADKMYLNYMNKVPGLNAYFAQGLLGGSGGDIKNAVDQINATNPAAVNAYDPSTYSGPLKSYVTQFLSQHPDVVANLERAGYQNPLTGQYSTKYLPPIFQNYFASNPAQAAQFAAGGVRGIKR